MVYSTVRPMLFNVDPERAHNLSIRALKIMQSNSFVRDQYNKKMKTNDSKLKSSYWGLDFLNPVGLAAGFDKHAEVYPGLSALGFGSVEIGSVTPVPQPGNTLPRLYRLPEDNGLINRMGFNSHGIHKVKENFEKLPKPQTPIGINLGKNKDTSNVDAASDYTKSLDLLYLYGDYFVINISSPNTKNLRDLQHTNNLKPFLEKILNTRNNLFKNTGKFRPIILKVAPDLTLDQLEQAVDIALLVGIDGLIVSNTTTLREGLTSIHKHQIGGLSGKPLAKRSTGLIHRVYKQTEGKIPIIGSGGIFTGQDAFEKLAAGANMVQVYTGMIYRGPSIAKYINNELLNILENKGCSSIQEVIGSQHNN
ncbi:quinone-dependent dihydroorotate dehydrogenase (plasmid) [Priestia megaterium]|uniref:quinone-dependent dihydroorotate dehydrogenase n=1 Tax=Priestia megaterium TaxID=1404 RepID=UPI00244C2C92|nr:quinone-dependent dihydroorotate dehydrogenase [Priestia megaterium]MDH2449550.1 quinone-dependent dihydroorotate dehydrogenase [Priestia megaterium]MDL5149008.1 quinone-dependent dihydroorotate dehydrogenase [Priestia megaterium]